LGKVFEFRRYVNSASAGNTSGGAAIV
jgi:hypothetical protein